MSPIASLVTFATANFDGKLERLITVSHGWDGVERGMIPSTNANTAVVAPTPRESISTASIVNPERLRSRVALDV
jgi:hypothetical protein